MNLTDLMSIEEWIEIEKEINRLSGLNAAVYDSEGKRVTEFKKWANRLCPAIRQTEKGLRFICSVAHQNLAAQVSRIRKTIVAECDAGMLKFAVPIFIDDEFLGVAGGCGMLNNGGQIDTYLVHRAADLAEKIVTNLSESVTPIPDGRLALVIGFLEARVDEIVREYTPGLRNLFEQAV